MTRARWFLNFALVSRNIFDNIEVAEEDPQGIETYNIINLNKITRKREGKEKKEEKKGDRDQSQW